MELSKKEFDKIKEIELDILYEIDRICKEHNISYSLTAGTLLGAVRHQGFIPWDDDIDIMMVREQYEKFISVARDHMCKKFFVVDYRYDDYYAFPFAKVMARNTVFKEKTNLNCKAPCGVFVDIFPLDPTSKILKERVKQYKKAQTIKSRLLCQSNYNFEQKKIKNMVWNIRKICYSLFSHDLFVKQFEKCKDIYKSGGSDYYISLCGTIGAEKASIPKEWLENYTEIQFENNLYPVISHYKELLNKYYGNYMLLPPKEQQIAHHFICELDLSSYDSKGGSL